MAEPILQSDGTLATPVINDNPLYISKSVAMQQQELHLMQQQRIMQQQMQQAPQQMQQQMYQAPQIMQQQQLNLQLMQHAPQIQQRQVPENLKIVIPEPVQGKKKQLSWTDEPMIEEKEDIRIERDRRTEFAKNEQIEQSFNTREQLLMDLEQESIKRLEALLVQAEGSVRRGGSHRIRFWRIRRELKNALHVFRDIQTATAERPDQIEVLREDYQNKLENIYQMGKEFLSKKESTQEQTELVKKLMTEANNAQLPSSRILLVRKERQYRREDEQWYGHAEQDNAVEKLSGRIREAIKFYTRANPIDGQMPGYQYMNKLLRGLMTEDKLPKENGVDKKVLKMIQRLNAAFGAGQKETKRLYRGVNLRNVYHDQIDKPESLVGRTYTDNAYMSTSRNRNKSVGFLYLEGIRTSAVDKFIELRKKNPQAPPPERIITGHSMIEIVARKGSLGIDIEAVTEVKEEEEVLFPPGTRVYLHSMKLSNTVVPATREMIWERLLVKEANDKEKAKEILDTIMPAGMNEIYINVAVPVFQGEIR